jgi:hypothetical protein
MENEKQIYVIDTCSFTELRRRYPQDVVPGAWKVLLQFAESGILISSNEVWLELEAQEDQVTDWAREHRKIFISLNPDIQIKATEILASYPNLLDIKKQKSSADPFLIATAIVEGGIVVTQETPNGFGSKYVKIPNVCQELKVPYIDLLELFRREKVKLDFSP